MKAYIQLGEEALQIVHRTFQPDTLVILHFSALADGSLDSNSNSPPIWYVIQEGINCMPTTDYFFTNVKPPPIIVTSSAAHQNKPTSQQAVTRDPISQQTHPLQPGKTRVYPSMITNKQVPVLHHTEPALPHRQTYKTYFNPFVCAPMVEKKIQKTKVQSDQLSDSDTPDEEVDP